MGAESFCPVSKSDAHALRPLVDTFVCVVRCARCRSISFPACDIFTIHLPLTTFSPAGPSLLHLPQKAIRLMKACDRIALFSHIAVCSSESLVLHSRFFSSPSHHLRILDQQFQGLVPKANYHVVLLSSGFEGVLDNSGPPARSSKYAKFNALALLHRTPN